MNKKNTTKILHWSEIKNIKSEDFDISKEEEIQKAKETAKTLIHLCKDKRGFGMAAPQIGVYKNIFVYRKFTQGSKFEVVVNPSYIPVSNKLVKTSESCFSVPEKSYFIQRNHEINVNYFDPYTKVFINKTIDGHEAIIFQHEHDHLLGISIAQLAQEE